MVVDKYQHKFELVENVNGEYDVVKRIPVKVAENEIVISPSEQASKYPAAVFYMVTAYQDNNNSSSYQIAQHGLYKHTLMVTYFNGASYEENRPATQDDIDRWPYEYALFDTANREKIEQAKLASVLIKRKTQAQINADWDAYNANIKSNRLPPLEIG